MKKALILFTLAFTSAASASVEEYKAAAAAFCDKMRMCINQNMEQEMGGEVPPQMREMVDGMAAQMCAQYVPQMFEERFTQYEDIIDQGTECLTEMQSLPCNAFEERNTPSSCKKMEQMAKDAGLVDE